MKQSILKNKTKDFALRTIRLYQYLCKEKQEYILSKQMLRSGTSIGANVAEAFYGQSEADFIFKLSIAQKEASETCIGWSCCMKVNICNKTNLTASSVTLKSS